MLKATSDMVALAKISILITNNHYSILKCCTSIERHILNSTVVQSNVGAAKPRLHFQFSVNCVFCLIWGWCFVAVGFWLKNDLCGFSSFLGGTQSLWSSGRLGDQQRCMLVHYELACSLSPPELLHGIKLLTKCLLIFSFKVLPIPVGIDYFNFLNS